MHNWIKQTTTTLTDKVISNMAITQSKEYVWSNRINIAESTSYKPDIASHMTSVDEDITNDTTATTRTTAIQCIWLQV